MKSKRAGIRFVMDVKPAFSVARTESRSLPDPARVAFQLKLLMLLVFVSSRSSVAVSPEWIVRAAGFGA